MENRQTVQYQLRPAVAADAVALSQVAMMGIPGYPFESVYNPAAVAAQIGTSAEHRIVAEHPELGVMATAVLGLADLMAEVKRVVVHPGIRRQGVARIMVNELVQSAIERGHIPWSDVRADQIGMQRAALAAGLIATSLEQGKHVVYSHSTIPFSEEGAARETMIHMTSLRLNPWNLTDELQQWPAELVEKLVANMNRAHRPREKQKRVVAKQLESAAAVKERITDRIERQIPSHISAEAGSDIEILQVDGAELVVIKPDASGFLTKLPHGELYNLFALAESIGLQIVTHYSPIENRGDIKRLSQAGMEPAMVRPWKPHKDEQVRWEVGWRRTMNGYEDSLHTIQLDPAVREHLDTLQIHIATNGIAR